MDNKSLLSFFTPCLQFKRIGYTISQSGFPDFITNQRRYLTSTCAWTRDDSSLGVSGGLDGQGEVISGTISQYIGTAVNAAPPTSYTGNTTPRCPLIQTYPYYGSTPPTNDPDQQWTVGLNTFTSVIKYYFPPLPGARVVTCVVTLSDEYTLAQLEADGDALLEQVLTEGTYLPTVGVWQPPPVINWGDTYIAEFGEQPTPNIITTLDDYVFAPNEFVAALSGVAYTGIGTQGTFYPNAFTKVTGYVMMSGLYRQRTVLIDFDVTHTIPSDGGIQCVSGSSQCGSTFTVNPPAASPTQNAFVTITPNAQCP